MAATSSFIVLEDLDTDYDPADVAGALVARMYRPFTMGNRAMDAVEQLLDRADMAIYAGPLTSQYPQ